MRIHILNILKISCRMLYKCYKELDKRFSVVNGKKLKK